MSDPKYVHIRNPEDRIIEECGEIIQAVIKGKRFGWDNYHPDKPNISNIRQLFDEICDVRNAYDELVKKIKLGFGLDKYCQLMDYSKLPDKKQNILDEDKTPMQYRNEFKK